MPSDSPAIEFDNLVKHFGKGDRLIKAVDGVSFSVPRGEIFGFLGPNGAGKTTAIRCVMDFIRPTSGAIRILGKDAQEHSVELNHDLGYLSGHVSFYDKWTGHDHIRYFSNLNGAATFDGSGDYVSFANSADVNTAVHDKRSVSVWFNANDVQTRQVIYEEGAHVRGLAIYLDSGRLYVSGWNTPGGESDWQGTYLSTDAVQADAWHHVALTLDGSSTLQNDAFRAYLDGEAFASGAGSQLWAHGGAIGLGAVNGGILFHDGQDASTGAHSLSGMTDEFRIYNRVLSADEAYGLFRFDEEIVLDPEIERDPIPWIDLVMHLTFNGDTADVSGNGNDATAKNGAALDANGKFEGAMRFDGSDDYLAFTDSSLINVGTHAQRSVSMWFNPDDVQNRQVLFEEGGTIRGLSLYIENGRLHAAGWNEPSGESNWQGTYLDLGAVTAGEWKHVVISLNGTPAVESFAFAAFVDGNWAADGVGSQLWSHSGDIGIGATNNDTKFESGDRSGTGIDLYRGLIDDVRVYNDALLAEEAALLAQM